MKTPDKSTKIYIMELIKEYNFQKSKDFWKSLIKIYTPDKYY